jgi:hypothetical protein
MRLFHIDGGHNNGVMHEKAWRIGSISLDGPDERLVRNGSRFGGSARRGERGAAGI